VIVRIAVIHSFYSSSQPSGENSVVLDQVNALVKSGYEVKLVARHTDQQSESAFYPLTTALSVATGRGFDPSRELREFQPDIVHIHNLFPNIGTAWLERYAGPVVVSVHNYRAVCSNGLLFRDGNPCNECVTRGPWRAVMHRCYRDSALSTIPVAMSRSRFGQYLLERADRVVTTSRASRDLLAASIPSPINTVLIPNFGSAELKQLKPCSDRFGWVSAGRFSPEKGFLELVEQWPVDQTLTLIGAGQLEEEIKRRIVGKNISFLPSMDRGDLRRILPHFVGFIFPSRWMEAAPQVVVEAMGSGLPIVAWQSNGVAELVRDSGAGQVYWDSHSLSAALSTVQSQCDPMSEAAQSVYRKLWSVEVWSRDMTNLYRDLISKTRIRSDLE
jgi:glycosyltransferase involved in cell wall biosynthesis